MADAKTRADSLYIYLTGAASDGGVQTDPDASLGDYRSSSEAEHVEATEITDFTTGDITIEYISGANDEGTGTLGAVGGSSVRWKYYDGTYGNNVSISNGETKVVESGDSPAAYVRVSRTSATALTGSKTLSIVKKKNSIFAFRDITGTEAAAGISLYRAVVLVNESNSEILSARAYLGAIGTAANSNSTNLSASGAGTIGTNDTFVDWPDAGWAVIDSGGTPEVIYYSSRTASVLTVGAAGRGLLGTSARAGALGESLTPISGIAIARDTNGVQDGGEQFLSIANETTAPSGVTWNVGVSADDGISIGDGSDILESGKQLALWLWKQVPAGAEPDANIEASIMIQFDAP